MGARPYDPSMGRFLSVDPIAGGSLNNYDYADQDPINGYDLDGTMDIGKPWPTLLITPINRPGGFKGGFTISAPGSYLLLTPIHAPTNVVEGYTITRPGPVLVNDDGLGKRLGTAVVIVTIAGGSNPAAGSAVNELTKHIQDGAEAVIRDTKEKNPPPTNREQRRGRKR